MHVVAHCPMHVCCCEVQRLHCVGIAVHHALLERPRARRSARLRCREAAWRRPARSVLARRVRRALRVGGRQGVARRFTAVCVGARGLVAGERTALVCAWLSVVASAADTSALASTGLNCSKSIEHAASMPLTPTPAPASATRSPRTLTGPPARQSSQATRREPRSEQRRLSAATRRRESPPSRRPGCPRRG